MTEEQSEEIYVLLGNMRCAMYGLKLIRRIAKASLDTVCDECQASDVVDSHAWNRLLLSLDDMQEIVKEIQASRNTILKLAKGDEE